MVVPLKHVSHCIPGSLEKLTDAFMRKSGFLARIPTLESAINEMASSLKKNNKLLEALQDEHTYKRSVDADRASKIIERLPLDTNDEVKKYLGDSMYR